MNIKKILWLIQTFVFIWIPLIAASTLGGTYWIAVYTCAMIFLSWSVWTDRYTWQNKESGKREKEE